MQLWQPPMAGKSSSQVGICKHPKGMNQREDKGSVSMQVEIWAACSAYDAVSDKGTASKLLGFVHRTGITLHADNAQVYNKSS